MFSVGDDHVHCWLTPSHTKASRIINYIYMSSSEDLLPFSFSSFSIHSPIRQVILKKIKKHILHNWGGWVGSWAYDKFVQMGFWRLHLSSSLLEAPTIWCLLFAFYPFISLLFFSSVVFFFSVIQRKFSTHKKKRKFSRGKRKREKLWCLYIGGSQLITMVAQQDQLIALI